MDQKDETSASALSWSDIVAISKKAQTGNLDEETSPPSKTQPLPRQPARPASQSLELQEEFSEQWKQVQEEAASAGRALANMLDTLLAGLLRAAAWPLVQVMKGLTWLLSRVVLPPFVWLFRHIEELLQGQRRFFEVLIGVLRRVSDRPAHTFDDADEEEDEHITLTGLLERGISFMSIRNAPLLQDIHQERQAVTRALDEIRSCANYAKDLPTPNRGRFSGIPIAHALASVTVDDLEAFLLYVSQHPKPFQEQQLKLAEAYATWIHKGTP